MSEVPVKVKWGKKSFDVTVNTAGTALEFKATLLSLTGLCLPSALACADFVLLCSCAPLGSACNGGSVTHAM